MPHNTRGELKTCQSFLVRSPRLAWTTHMEALARARSPEDVREALDTVLGDAEIRDALFRAAPTLETLWTNAPEPMPERLLLTISGYLFRMTARATPQGWLAGVAAGTWGSAPQWAFGAQSRNQKRLGTDHLVLHSNGLRAMLEHLWSPNVRFSANNTLWRTDAQWRYLAFEYEGFLPKWLEGRVARSEVLDEILRHPHPRSAEQWVNALPADAGSLPEKKAFVEQLVAAQLLVPHLRWQCASEQPFVADTVFLEKIFSEANENETLFTEEKNRPENPNLFYHELFRDTADQPIVLPQTARRALETALHALHRLALPSEPPELARFKRAFLQRYGLKEVPLVEALDPELGLGYPLKDFRGGPAEALLPNWLLPEPPPTLSAGPRERLLAEKLAQSLANGRSPIVLTDHDWWGWPEPALPLPPTFAVLATILPDGNGWLRQAGGTTGLSAGNRFAHLHPDWAKTMQELALHERAQTPEDTLIADLLCLPGDLPHGNLNRLGFEPETVIAVWIDGDFSDKIRLSELWLRLDGQRLTLTRGPGGPKVLPRLGTPVNPAAGTQHAVFRFLADIGAEGLQTELAFEWGPSFAAFGYLPRVAYQQMVLAPAQWRISPEHRQSLAKATEAYLSAWLAQNQVPEQVWLHADGQQLYLDLRGWAGRARLLSALRGEGHLRLEECLCAPSASPFRAPEGPLANEVVFFVKNETPRPETPFRKRHPLPEQARTAFFPGDCWLSCRLYGHPALFEKWLLQALAPLAAEWQAQGLAERWFFLRYADPRPHLRWRLLAPDLERAALLREALLEKIQASGLLPAVSDLLIDTYHPEFERYGYETMPLVEGLWAQDSHWVCTGLGLAERLEFPPAWRQGLGMLRVKKWVETGLPAAERESFFVHALREMDERFEGSRPLRKALRAARPDTDWLHSGPIHSAVTSAFSSTTETETGLWMALHAQFPDDAAMRHALLSDLIHLFANRLFEAKNDVAEYGLLLWAADQRP